MRRFRRLSTVVVMMALIGATLSISLPAASQVFTCNGQVATIVGTEGRDYLVGTSGPDVIVALGGSDRVRSLGGDDVICAGPGRDRVWAGAGNDRIEGGPGRDRLLGQAGDDTVLGGSGRDAVKGGQGIDLVNGGVSTDTCLAGETVRNCEKGDLAAQPTVDRVLHISIDGLRPDHITTALMPNLRAFVDRSASTMNARTDPDSTKTLPNHTAQFTGRPVFGDNGHGTTYNEDMFRTVHDEAGEYVASVFDVVHDHGGRTAVYAGKSKFDMIDRNWNGTFGAEDRTGENNGRDKLDVFERNDPVDSVDVFLDDLEAMAALEYVFFHIRSPDEFGHTGGWGSSLYREGVAEADLVFGRLIDAIGANPSWASSTAVIVVSDHGGPLGEDLHSEWTSPENYTIPFVVWTPTVAAGADLYALNAGVRRDPGTGRPTLDGAQPIRGHEAANLALDLLGLPAVPDSTFNRSQDLRVDLG